MTITRTFDTATSSLVAEIKKHHSRVFRRAYVKRRSATTGLLEADWVEITSDVKSWGTIGSNIDIERYGKVEFIGTNLVMDNESGRYNGSANSDSLWSGYAAQDRSLVKIECGFIHQYLGTDGIWRNTVYPTDPTVFVGIIYGNINYSDRGEVTLPIKPLSQLFRDFPMSRMPTPAGSHPTTFCEELRDLTSGGSYVFRQFFGDTTSNWQIDTVGNASAKITVDVYDTAATDRVDAWSFIEKNMEAFNCAAYITPTGGFRLTYKDPPTTAATFEFYGRSRGAAPNGEYGHTIKDVSFYGPALDSYYTRVNYFYGGLTPTPIQVQSTALAFALTGSNLPWTYGDRTMNIESGSDMRIAILGFTGSITTDISKTLVASIFDDVARVDERIEFTTSLITHLNLLDRVEITFDSSGIEAESGLWDLNKWDTELVWDAGASGSISLTSEPFKIISVKINLDNLETTFIARQLN